jgi:hypothetical protein
MMAMIVRLGTALTVIKMTTEYKFAIGDKVRQHYNSVIGEITGINDDEIWVKWENGSEYTVESCEIKLHDPVADKKLAIKVQAKLNEAAHSLEAAFKAWNEAIELYGQDAYALKFDDLIDTRAFESVIESNGWSNSSLYC